MQAISPWGWRKTSVEGQQIINYVMTPQLDAIMTVTLFLRGPVMDEADGCPLRASRLLFGEERPPLLAAPVQEHGTRMIEALPSTSLPARPKGDALLLRRTDVLGSLRFADCIPVVAVAEEQDPWVFLVHSGFLGTAKGVVREALKKAMKTTGLRCLDSVHFWVGPGIGSCCYSRRLDDPRTREGLELFPRQCIRVDGDLVFFDLPSAILITLYDMNVSSSNVVLIDRCTSCSSESFYSYRGGDRTGRSLLLAGFREGFHKSDLWWENGFEGVE